MDEAPFLFSLPLLDKQHVYHIDNDIYKLNIIRFSQEILTEVIHQVPKSIRMLFYNDPWTKPIWNKINVKYLLADRPDDSDKDLLLAKFKYLESHWRSYRNYALESLSIDDLNKFYNLQIELISYEEECHVYAQFKKMIVNGMIEGAKITEEKFIDDPYFKDLYEMVDGLTLECWEPSKKSKDKELELWRWYFGHLLNNHRDIDKARCKEHAALLPKIVINRVEFEHIFNLYSKPSADATKTRDASKLFVFKQDINDRNLVNVTLHLVLGFSLESSRYERFLSLALKKSFIPGFSRYLDMAELLIIFGADVNDELTKDSFIDLASLPTKSGDKDLLKWLISRGFNVNSQKYLGDTVLHVCKESWSNHSDNGRFTRYLLSVGADPNIENIYGQTALDLVIENGDLIKVRALLESDAKKCRSVHTLNYNVRKNKRKRIMTLLELYGVKIKFVKP